MHVIIYLYLYFHIYIFILFLFLFICCFINLLFDSFINLCSTNETAHIIINDRGGACPTPSPNPLPQKVAGPPPVIWRRMVLGTHARTCIRACVECRQHYHTTNERDVSVSAPAPWPLHPKEAGVLPYAVEISCSIISNSHRLPKRTVFNHICNNPTK